MLKLPASATLNFNYRIYCAILVLFLAGILLAKAQDISTKQQELRRLRESIATTKAQLDKLAAKERTTNRRIYGARKQQHRVSSFIAALQQQLTALQDSASVIEQHVKATASKLAKAEAEYSGLTEKYWLYSKSTGTTSASPLHKQTFTSISESIRRYKISMGELKDSLQVQQSLLNSYQQAQEQILHVQSSEQARLKVAEQQSKSELQKIRSDKQLLSKELQATKQRASTIRGVISSLIAKQARELEQKKAAARAKRNSRTLQQEPKSIGGFSKNSLPWPTSARVLLHGYGTYKNEASGATFENPGIDIRTSEGSNVQCVAAGTVSSVSWLPGFGSVVIVDHGNTFRTVYANLASVRVTRGGKVATGTSIGTSGENLDGAMMHFEVWRGREQQNPLSYLR